MKPHNGRYILVNGVPTPEPNLRKWGEWMANFPERQVASTDWDGVRVSTVFLGLDHSWGQGDPVLWETMIFGGPADGEQWRYRSLEAARAGHEKAVEVALIAQRKNEPES
jgi:hypothetical protein